MSERARRLQAVGSLLGRAAGHGVLYGPLQREVFLYSEQARERLDDLGKLRPGESEEIRSRALKVGEGTVREAFARGKRVLPSSLAEALSVLPGEVDRLLADVF